jgi:FSR family fosmidomycin resistance protein-like MFS transporter
MVPAVLPVVMDEFGLSLLQASMLLSTPLIVRMTAIIPAGIISDRFGSYTIPLGFIINTIGAYGIATSKTLTTMIIGTGLLILGDTIFHPPSLKTASTLESSKMNFTMGVHLAGGSLGLALGPITLSILLPIFGWRSAFLIWVPFSSLVSIISYLYSRKHLLTEHKNEKTVHSKTGELASIFTRNFILVVSAGALFELTIVNLSGFTTTLFKTAFEMSERLASLVFGLGSTVGILGALLGGTLGNRFSVYKVATANLLLTLGFLAIMPLTKRVIAISTIYLIYRIFVSASMPLINTMIASNSSIHNRSLAFSIYFMLANLLGSLLPAVTSLFAKTYSILIIFPISIILLTPALIMILTRSRY